MLWVNYHAREPAKTPTGSNPLGAAIWLATAVRLAAQSTGVTGLRKPKQIAPQ